MIKIKTVKVTNNKNVVVQIPLFVIEEWGLQNGDKLDFYRTEGGAIIIVPGGKKEWGAK